MFAFSGIVLVFEVPYRNKVNKYVIYCLSKLNENDCEQLQTVNYFDMIYMVVVTLATVGI